MMIGPDHRLECPSCGRVHWRLNVLSGNTLGATHWTDGFMDASMLPETHEIGRCRGCRRRYWRREAKETEAESYGPMLSLWGCLLGATGPCVTMIAWRLVSGAWPDLFLSGLPFWALCLVLVYLEGWLRGPEFGPLTLDDLHEALESQHFANDDEERYLRTRARWRANDRWRGKRAAPTNAAWMEPRDVANLERLAELMAGDWRAADVLRQLGRFDEARGALVAAAQDPDDPPDPLIASLIEQGDAGLRECSGEPSIVIGAI